MREQKPSLAVPSSLVLSLEFGNCATATERVLITQEEAGIVNFQTDERFILRSNEPGEASGFRAKTKILFAVSLFGKDGKTSVSVWFCSHVSPFFSQQS